MSCRTLRWFNAATCKKEMVKSTIPQPVSWESEKNWIRVRKRGKNQQFLLSINQLFIALLLSGAFSFDLLDVASEQQISLRFFFFFQKSIFYSSNHFKIKKILWNFIQFKCFLFWGKKEIKEQDSTGFELRLLRGQRIFLWRFQSL